MLSTQHSLPKREPWLPLTAWETVVPRGYCDYPTVEEIKQRMQIHSAGFFNLRMRFTKVGRLHVPRLTSVTPEYGTFRRV